MPAAIKLSHMERIPGTRLRYLQDAPKIDKRRRADFICDCGSLITTDLHWVRFLNVTSCGCYKTEVVTAKNTKHSHAVRGAPSGAYRSWQALHQRAVGNDPNYAHVHVCARWSGKDGFVNFLADMGDRPDGHTIERKKNNKGYEPSNCIWATYHTQAQNTSQTVNVTIAGQTHSINEWCRIKGIGYHLIKQRRARGMSLEDAITQPLDLKKSFKRK